MALAPRSIPFSPPLSAKLGDVFSLSSSVSYLMCKTRGRKMRGIVAPKSEMTSRARRKSRGFERSLALEVCRLSQKVFGNGWPTVDNRRKVSAAFRACFVCSLVSTSSIISAWPLSRRMIRAAMAAAVENLSLLFRVCPERNCLPVIELCDPNP